MTMHIIRKMTALMVLSVCIQILPTQLLIGQSETTENAYQYTIRKKATGEKGAVVSAHPLATRAGLDILKKGGNAIDASIAVQLALAVVYPGAGNLGGGGFLVASLADGKTLAIDYREKAPAAAHRDMYLDSAGNARTDRSQNGHLAGGVPGTVAGLFASHKHGKLPFSELIAPAIELAEKGFAVTAAEASSLNNNKASFLKYSTRPTALVKKAQWKAGDTLVQSELAETLKRIRDGGQPGFYEGETARFIIEEMQRGGGLISYEDLRNYQARERTAIRFPYKGYEILTMPLPSSGGIIIRQALGMMESRDLPSLGFQTPASVQLMTEVERRAYADRAEFMGDVDFVKVPVKRLMSDDYIRQRMADYQPGMAGKSSVTGPGRINPESEETTHLSVADRWGNAVAVTTTLNGGYGSHTVIGRAGFLLNNEMDDFSVKPGVPNMYGALGTEANAITPGKRMLSSMTPTIVLKDTKPYLVVGTPGGTTIPTSVLQTIVNILDFGLSIEDAVYKPKFHHQWQPDVIAIENGFPENVANALKSMGYTLTKRGQIGRTEVIRINRSGRRKLAFEAVGDIRGDDHAAAY